MTTLEKACKVTDVLSELLTEYMVCVSNLGQEEFGISIYVESEEDLPFGTYNISVLSSRDVTSKEERTIEGDKAKIFWNLDFCNIQSPLEILDEAISELESKSNGQLTMEYEDVGSDYDKDRLLRLSLRAGSLRESIWFIRFERGKFYYVEVGDKRLDKYWRCESSQEFRDALHKRLNSDYVKATCLNLILRSREYLILSSRESNPS